MKIYSLRSVSLNYYNKPFYCDNDMEAMNLLRNACISGQDIHLIANMKDLELCSIGEFSSSDGIKSTKIKKIINCSEIPLIAELAKEVIENAENLQAFDS